MTAAVDIAASGGGGIFFFFFGGGWVSPCWRRWSPLRWWRSHRTPRGYNLTAGQYHLLDGVLHVGTHMRRTVQSDRRV